MESKIIVSQTKRYSVFDSPPKILVLGATGYLGQFLVVHLRDFASEIIALGSKDADYAGEYEAIRAKLNSVGAATADMVINCAAMSMPGECAKNPERAYKLNVPQHILRYLIEETGPSKPLLVHLSTDQVYDGTRALWTESSETKPINDYGKSKLKGEEEIRAQYPGMHVILRSSIIVGPQPPIAKVSRPLMLDFIIDSLRNATNDNLPKFFSDEYRNPVSVFDIVEVCQRLFRIRSQFRFKGKTFNMGGSDRLSRFDMAMVVAQVLDLNSKLAEGVPASSVSRGVLSPADISMDSSLLQTVTGLKLKSFKDTMFDIKPMLGY